MENARYIQTDKVVERFDYIDILFTCFILPDDAQLHIPRISKPLHIEKRIASLDVEHIAKHVSAIKVNIIFADICRLYGKVIERILVLLQTHIFETMAAALT